MFLASHVLLLLLFSMPTITPQLLLWRWQNPAHVTDSAFSAGVATAVVATEGDEGRPSEEECGKFKSFWEQFGRAIKLGIMEDQNNK